MRAGALALLAALAAVVAVAALGGCADPRRLRAEAPLPDAARAMPERYVVITVRNVVRAPGAAAASTPRGYDGGGAYLAGGVARRTVRALARDYRLREVSSWPIRVLGVHCVAYALPAGAELPRVLAALAGDPRVEAAQPLQNFATAGHAYNDPYSGLQRNLAPMEIAEAQALSRGAGVRIAVIDTGVALRHPDLPARLTARNFVDADEPGFQGDAHGTAIAGIIGAVTDNGVGIVGIAPDARLFLYKACWRTAATGIRAACNSYTLARAIAAAVEARVDIINLSLAGPSDPLLTRLVRRAVDAGIVVVGAVPPEGERSGFPSGIDAVIAVDAIESGGTGAQILRAPGRDILSLAPGGHYDFYSGSSLATAEVSGLVALLRARRPQLAAGEAQTLLLDSAQRAAGDRRAAVPDGCRALARLLGGGNCAVR